MVLIGGVLTIAYGINSGKPLVALNIGISAPLILKALAAAAPPVGANGARGNALGPADPSLFNFVAGR